MSSTRPLAPQNELSAVSERAGPGGRTGAADAVGTVAASAAATTSVVVAALARANPPRRGRPDVPALLGPDRPDARRRDALMNAPPATSGPRPASPRWCTSRRPPVPPGP